MFDQKARLFEKYAPLSDFDLVDAIMRDLVIDASGVRR